MNKIYLCQTCSGRKWQAIETVSHNINAIKVYYRMEKPSVNYFHDWPMCSICIVDYNCKDNITEYLLNEHAEDIVNGFLSIFKVENDRPWHMAIVKNIAMRMGIRLGGSYVVSLDIDNFVTPKEIRLLASLNRNGTSYHGINSFYDGSCGRIGCSSNNFLRCRGFREDAPSAGIHDIDLIKRLSTFSDIVEFPPVKSAVENTHEERISNTDLSVENFDNNDISFMFYGAPPEMGSETGTLYHERNVTKTII